MTMHRPLTAFRCARKKTGTLANSSWGKVYGIFSGGVLVVIVVVLGGLAIDNLGRDPAESEHRRGVERPNKNRIRGRLRRLGRC